MQSKHICTRIDITLIYIGIITLMPSWKLLRRAAKLNLISSPKDAKLVSCSNERYLPNYGALSAIGPYSEAHIAIATVYIPICYRPKEGKSIYMYM